MAGGFGGQRATNPDRERREVSIFGETDATLSRTRALLAICRNSEIVRLAPPQAVLRILDRAGPVTSLRKAPMLVAHRSPSMGPAACLLATRAAVG